MTRAAVITAWWLLTCASLGQDVALPTIRSASTLVAVPALVRSPSGELVKNLEADRFELLDNGAPRKTALEQTDKQPIAEPNSHQPGFHTITVRVAGHQNFRITARTSYWFDQGSPP